MRRRDTTVVVAAVVAAFVVSWLAGGPAGGLKAAATPTPVAPADPLPRGTPELPDGVRVISEPKGFVADDDVLAGTLAVPDGKLAVDDYFITEEPQVELDVPAGTHDLRVTRAIPVASRQRPGRVALVTLTTAASEPVRWRRVGQVGTDGGMAEMASREAGARMVVDEDLGERALGALNASGADQVGEVRIADGLNLFAFSAGLGDGGYPVYAGIDAKGAVARVVLDGGLLHLDWPAAQA